VKTQWRWAGLIGSGRGSMKIVWLQVLAECCESFARTDIRGKTIPDSTRCRVTTSRTTSSVPVVNNVVSTDATIRLPGFHLSRRSWLLLNHFRTGRCEPVPVMSRHIWSPWLWSVTNLDLFSQHTPHGTTGKLYHLMFLSSDRYQMLISRQRVNVTDI